MSPLLLPLVLPLLSAAPPAGSYEIVRDQVQVERKLWGLFCGPADEEPASSVGERVALTRQGAEWVAAGSGRRFGSATCEGEANPTLKAVERRQEGDWIVFTCRSQRVTRGTESTTHRVRVSESGAIEWRTRGQHEFRKDGDLCQTAYTRATVAVPREVEGAAPAADPEDPCESPGAPASLSLSPRVFDVKVGGAPVCLEARARDANGCSVPARGVTFAVDPPELGAVSEEGCFRPAKSIREEQAVGVVARLGEVEAAVSARVVPASMRRAKKTLKALAKTTKSKRAAEVLGEVTRGEITLRPLETEPPELPPLEAEAFPVVPVAGGGLAALLASAAGLALARRRRRMRLALEEEVTDLQAKPVVTPKKGGGLVCPQCSFEFAVGEATRCPFDDTALAPLERDARQTMFVPVAGGMVCPVCFTRYPTKARFCGHDRAPLVPDFGQFANKTAPGDD